MVVAMTVNNFLTFMTEYEEIKHSSTHRGGVTACIQQVHIGNMLVFKAPGNDNLSYS